MFGSSSLATRPLACGSRLPRPYKIAALAGEYGWSAWSFSRQAKLNAWGWHGLGMDNLHAWANLGNNIYTRKEADSFVHLMQPEVFTSSADSQSVEATTQWLDFKSPGKRKALTGIDFDGTNVATVEVYVSEAGNRAGVLAESIVVGSHQGGWTYSGELLPLSCDGTEFKLRFICLPGVEARINRLSIHFDELAD